MRIDPADKVFSQYIRLRDGRCMRCGSIVSTNYDGLPNSHQASHYFGRRKESVRFDPENVDCLCGACHMYWEKENREEYREFKIKQLGQDGFDALVLRANTPGKKDRKMALIVSKALLKDIIDNGNERL